MKVYGLSGKSGTGKSFRAPDLCRKLGIDGLIDDGLFILNGNIAAGQSAKKEETKLGAIKRALFVKEEHRSEVRDVIFEENPEKILILGTSEKMIVRIAEVLGLPAPSEIIKIDDITTEEEREEASRKRETDGTHVIPAPTLQLKKQFSGYFLDSKKGFRMTDQGALITEKTIVRPTYSYLGNFSISDRVIADIVTRCAENIEGIAKVIWVACDNDEKGLYVRAIINFKSDAEVFKCATELQKRASHLIAYMTAFNVLGIDVEVHGFA